MENRIVELEMENLRLLRLIAELLITNQQLREAQLLANVIRSEQDGAKTNGMETSPKR
jgi:hypothetical protein